MNCMTKTVRNVQGMATIHHNKDMNKSNVWEYELLDWINLEKINWGMLSVNPNAINILEKNLEKIDCHQTQMRYIY
jgi:hypothetical protein